MASQFITPKEIIEVKKLFPNDSIFTLDVDNTKESNNKTFLTYYIPFTCRRLVGNPTRLNLKVTKQVISSNAKISFGILPKDAKDVQVVFRALNKEDLAGTDYLPPVHKSIVEQNNEFIQALDIIADDYEMMVNSDVLPYDGDKFELRDRKVHNVRQTHRKASKEEKKEDKKLPIEERIINIDNKTPLPYPLYRAKIQADFISKKLGVSTKKGHRYNVFDARKVTKANKYKPVVAKLREGRLPVDLTTDNAKHFITYMSLIGGVMDFDSVCVSKSGISLKCSFRDIHVWPHKPMKIITLDDDDIADMANMGVSGYDSGADIDEPEEKNNECDVDDFGKSRKHKSQPIKTKHSNSRNKTQKLKKKSDDDEVYLKDDVDDEPEERDDEPEEASEEASEEEASEEEASEEEASEEEDLPPKNKNKISSTKNNKSTRKK
jgi:hypothetical protein